jgi:hypothetical protein
MIGIALRYVRISIALLLGAAFTSSAGILPAPSLAQAGTLRIALLTHAQVLGDAVLLADFMPAHIPSRLRAIAESISLGSAPQIGSTRTFSRATLAAALEDVRLSRDSFLIPEFLTARRAGHFLTQQDVFTAIEAALTKNKNVPVPTLRPQDLTLESIIEVPEGPSTLEVTQMTFDESIRRARFRLWPRNASGTLPFYVTAPIKTEKSTQPVSGPNASVLSAKSAILVDPRQLARLHLHSANSTMLLLVRPLQAGHLNETIRVRLVASGRTLQAKVIAANSLDATF